MRRKTFDVLFETNTGMGRLGSEHCLWRSGWYFFLSLGMFGGVVSNHLLAYMPLGVRLGVVLAVVLIVGVSLTMYGFLIHGIMETLGTTSGNPVALICLLGYTALPFLVLTPLALLSTRIGYDGILLFALVLLIGLLWMLYLFIRALQVVYIIDLTRAAAVVFFSLLLLYVAFVLPLHLLYKLVNLQLMM